MTATASELDTAVARLEAWLETMRGPDGYGGPVAHWWQQNFMYTGLGLDWRYEGIITGYLALWRRTGNDAWLAKSCRAAGDILAGQLGNGNYRASAFEINPAAAGTPHEAACDVGLLSLAVVLRDTGRGDWEQYVAAAERNLRGFYIDQLWDDEMRSFRDSPRVPSFVPNKAATACEALFLLAVATGTARWVEQYALPTLDRVLEHQVHQAGSLRGAIVQNSLGTRRMERYFPLYIGRCVPALVRGYEWTHDDRYLDAALAALRFIARCVGDDGSVPTVVYPDEQACDCPSWIAALGDILRASDELAPYGVNVDVTAVETRLLAGQDATGGIQTASGFAAQTGGRLRNTPDVRDVLHVVGWCDKAFRYLATRVGPTLPAAESARVELACTFRRESMRLVETPETLEITGQRGPYYLWHKGESWPEIASPAFWLQ